MWSNLIDKYCTVDDRIIVGIDIVMGIVFVYLNRGWVL